MSEVKMYEQQLEECKKQAEAHKKMQRLVENPDFKEVIIEGFVLQECARYTGMSVNLSLAPEQRENAAMFAKCTALLNQWLDLNLRLTADAEAGISEIQEALNLARAEEASFGAGE